MDKTKSNNKRYDHLNSWIVERVAEMYGVSERYVRMVIGGDRNREDILGSYLSIQEGATTSAMIEAVTALVPFENAAI